MSETPGQVLGRLMDERRDRYTAEGLWWEDDAEMDALAAAFLAEIDNGTIFYELARRDWDIRGVIPNERRAE